MSPFKSSKQRAWMHANKPEMADRWEREEHSSNMPMKKKVKPMMNDMPRKHAKRMDM